MDELNKLLILCCFVQDCAGLCKIVHEFNNVKLCCVL